MLEKARLFALRELFSSFFAKKSTVFSFFSQKLLTKGGTDDIIDKPHSSGSLEKGTYRKRLFEKPEKNFEKSLEKGLTKGKRCGKIERSLSESRRQSVIEN